MLPRPLDAHRARHSACPSPRRRSVPASTLLPCIVTLTSRSGESRRLRLRDPQFLWTRGLITGRTSRRAQPDQLARSLHPIRPHRRVTEFKGLRVKEWKATDFHAAPSCPPFTL